MAWAGVRRWGWLALLLCAAPVWAAEPRTYPESGVQTFLGLDDTSAPTQVADGRAQDVQNVLLSLSHDLRKRYGYGRIGGTLDTYGESFPAITGLYYTKFSSGTERIIATVNGRAYYLLNGTTWTEISTAQVTITGGQNNQFVWTTALDEIIGTNGVNPPIRYDGTTLRQVNFTGLSNAVTTAKTVAFFKNYLVVANTTEGGTTYATRFRWSNVGTTTTWSNADFVDIGALGGQEIVALAELYDNLYVFLTDSIYKVSLVGGVDTFQVSKVTDDIGCIAKNSVQSITLSNAQSGLVFLDKDKRVYFFNGVIAQDLGTLITTALGALSGSRLQYAVSADTTTDYVLCATTGTAAANNVCLDFQYQIGEWTKHTPLDANAMASVLDNAATTQVYWGSTKAFVYQYQDTSKRDDVGTASGTISAVSRYQTSTESSLQVLYDSSLSLTTGALAGAPIELVGGTGSGQTATLADNTATGLVITADFATQPDSSTTYEVGAIDARYTSKWYDLREAARLKHFGEVYFWADADVSSTLAISYATDFNADISTQSISLSASSTDAIWGSAVWGVSLWGSVDTIFRQVKLESQGRYLRLKWAEDDPQEDFHVFGYVPVYWLGDVN